MTTDLIHSLRELVSNLEAGYSEPDGGADAPPTDKELEAARFLREVDGELQRMLAAINLAADALASIALSEYESTSSAHEKVTGNARRAREAGGKIRAILSVPSIYTFGIEVPGEAPFTLSVQEDNEAAARRQVEAMLARTYLSRDGKVGPLLSVRK